MTSKYHAFSGEPSVEVGEGLWFCEKRDLWWKDGKVYDRLSAGHNGLIGAGAILRKVIKVHNEGGEQ